MPFSVIASLSTHICDAVDDGATVPIYYEPGRQSLDLNHEELETPPTKVDELVEDEEAGAAGENQRRLSRPEKRYRFRALVFSRSPDPVRYSILKTRNTAMNGKAMIVAMSREIRGNCGRCYRGDTPGMAWRRR